MSEKCPGCGAQFESIAGPVHEYIESSPGCWKAYSEILAREYENYSRMEEIHRLTVDAYAVQHPGRPGKKSTQSVYGHLLSLYAVFELNYSATQARELLGRFVAKKQDLPWLDPPDFAETLTVRDLLRAASLEEHMESVRTWSRSLWSAWKARHGDEITKIVEQL